MAVILNRQITESEKMQIIERFGRKCYATGHDILETDEIHFDHIVPLEQGGINDVCNMQLSCKICNLQKHTSALTNNYYQMPYFK